MATTTIALQYRRMTWAIGFVLIWGAFIALLVTGPAEYVYVSLRWIFFMLYLLYGFLGLGWIDALILP
jgi:hypothetical protein